MDRRATTTLLVALALALGLGGRAAAAPARWWPDRDVTHVNLHVGPLRVDPGQNVIRFRILHQRPKVNGYPTFAAGEEKTRVHAPQGFGYRYQPSDEWLLSYMIHNLTPQSASVCLTYDVGFIPRTSRHARG